MKLGNSLLTFYGYQFRVQGQLNSQCRLELPKQLHWIPASA